MDEKPAAVFLVNGLLRSAAGGPEASSRRADFTLTDPPGVLAEGTFLLFSLALSVA